MEALSLVSQEQGEICYSMIKSTCRTQGAEGSTVYGIEAFYSGDFLNHVKIEDISANLHDIDRLIFRLKKGQVAPDNLFYIVEDYIVELNS